MFNLEKIRADFPILGSMVNGKPLVYLDNGATAQKPLCVIEKTDEFMRKINANIHRGVHSLSMQATEAYEAARGTVRDFINAENSAEIVFTSGATASINAVAYSFAQRYINRGDNVVVSEMEHHSNIVPWQIVCQMRGAELRVLTFDDNGRLETEKLSRLIDEHTKIVAVTQASNVLGTRPDLENVISVSHGAGVPVLIDGCQGIVHGGVDVQKLDCDFYVFSGHKLYGPTGTGVLYGKQKWLEDMPPFMGGGDMVKTVSFKETIYADIPLKFEAGTANYIGAVGLAEAISYIENLNKAEVEAHENRLLQLATEGLEQIEGMIIYGRELDKCSIISFNVDRIHPTDIGMILDKQGVAIRTGHHCAEPVMDHFGVTGMCRASFALYNTEEEIDAFLKAVNKAVTMLR